jgi:hypothetical protein
MLLLNGIGDSTVIMVKHLRAHGMLSLRASRFLHAPRNQCTEGRMEMPLILDYLNIIVLASFPENGFVPAIMARIQRFQY